MATSSTSYLQTLAKDEAITFVASLQKVKDHLSQSLLWMEAQVQQKMVQLQGIAVLLSEAEVLGLVTAATHSTAGVIATAATQANALELPDTADGSTSIVTATEPVAAAIVALPTKKTSKQSRGQQGKAASATTSRGTRSSASTKTSTVKVKQATSSTLPASKAAQRGKASNLQRFLKSQWRDKALIEAVSDILNRATAPLSTDELMAALYDGLPQADYDRAKHSLANILSVGRSKGTWNSAGRGLYTAQTVVTA